MQRSNASSGGGHRRKRRRWALGAALGVVILVLAGGGAFLLFGEETGDVVNPDVPFIPETAPAPDPPPPTKARAEQFRWPIFGFRKARTRYLEAPNEFRPPLRRRWKLGGSVLLEFPPVVQARSLYLLKNNAALYAISRRNGRVRWKRKLGKLAAASPAADDKSVYSVILERGKGIRRGRVVAVSTGTGRTRWSRKLASRSETSPLLHRGRIYIGTEDGTVYAIRIRDGAVRWRYKAAGAVKGAIAYKDRTLYFGDYGGQVHAIRTRDGSRVWKTGTSGTRLGLGSGNFYSTAAVAFGRVYLGNTDGRVYSFSAKDGRLAWAKRTGGFVYSSPAVANLSGLGPTVWIGSYDGYLYALDARSGRVRWRYRAGGKISGAPTVVGDIVYFANLSKRETVGLGARTGHRVWRFGRGGFNPIIADRLRIYLTGYSSLYAFVPKGS